MIATRDWLMTMYLPEYMGLVCENYSRDKGDFDFVPKDIETISSQTEVERLKLVELNQSFRREIGLTNPMWGRLVLSKLKESRIPVIQFGIEIDNIEVTRELTGLISLRPAQLNVDILGIR